MEGYIKDEVFARFGLYNVLGYEESANRGYLTFTCNQGTYMAVMAKYGDEVVFYKFDRRVKLNEI